MELINSLSISDKLTIIGIIITIITSISLPKLLRKLAEWYKKSKSVRHENKTKEFYKVLNSDAFQKWRDEVLKGIYGPDMFTKVFNVNIPAFSMNFSKYFDYSEFQELYYNDIGNHKEKDLPFESYDQSDGDAEYKVPQIEDLSIMKEGTSAEISMKKSYVKEYKSILKDSVRHPHLIGFMLDKYDFDENGKITHIHSKIGNYELNLYTSHILEYELYRAYLKVEGKIVGDDIWNYLPFRKYIHFGTKGINKGLNLKDAIISGTRRYSLFSVQCFVMFKNKSSEDYSVLLMRRSDDPKKVAAKLGFYQFMPAGGFELFEQDETNTIDCIKRNYSLRKAILREYLEEVFGKDEFKCVKDDENEISYYTILNDNEIQKLLRLIKIGKAQFKLLGVAVDLVSMRHEISFLLKIDDEDYFSNNINPNSEFTRRNSSPSRNVIPNGLKFLRNNQHINQGSAILFHLAKEYFSNQDDEANKKLYHQFCECEEG